MERPTPCLDGMPDELIHKIIENIDAFERRPLRLCSHDFKYFVDNTTTNYSRIIIEITDQMVDITLISGKFCNVLMLAYNQFEHSGQITANGNPPIYYDGGWPDQHFNLAISDLFQFLSKPKVFVKRLELRVSVREYATVCKFMEKFRRKFAENPWYFCVRTFHARTVLKQTEMMSIVSQFEPGYLEDLDVWYCCLRDEGDEFLNSPQWMHAKRAKVVGRVPRDKIWHFRKFDGGGSMTLDEVQVLIDTTISNASTFEFFQMDVVSANQEIIDLLEKYQVFEPTDKLFPQEKLLKILDDGSKILISYVYSFRESDNAENKLRISKIAADGERVSWWFF